MQYNQLQYFNPNSESQVQQNSADHEIQFD